MAWRIALGATLVFALGVFAFAILQTIMAE